MSHRWLIHPPPYPGEALSSWLIRLSHQFMGSPERLLEKEFGIPIKRSNKHRVDFDPPQTFIEALARKSGQDPTVIRGLTARGYVPRLLDSLEEAPFGVNHYINELEFVLSLHYRKARLARVLPWYSLRRFRTPRGCRTCLLESVDPYLRLHWRFAWAMSCPIHGLWLEPFSLQGRVGERTAVIWDNDVADERPVPADLLKMDVMTLQAITGGMCDTPWGKVEGKLWLRLLRTLLEDLSTAAGSIGFHRHSIGKLWTDLNRGYRNDMGHWRPYETMNQDEQEVFMLVAARVIAGTRDVRISHLSKEVRRQSLLASRAPGEQSTLTFINAAADLAEPE